MVLAMLVIILAGVKNAAEAVVPLLLAVFLTIMLNLHIGIGSVPSLLFWGCLIGAVRIQLSVPLTIIARIALETNEGDIGWRLLWAMVAQIQKYLAVRRWVNGQWAWAHA